MAARGLISKEGTLLAPAGQRAKRTPCSLLVAAPRCPLHSWDKWDIPYTPQGQGRQRGTREHRGRGSGAEGNSETRTISLCGAHSAVIEVFVGNYIFLTFIYIYIFYVHRPPHWANGYRYRRGEAGRLALAATALSKLASVANSWLVGT